MSSRGVRDAVVHELRTTKRASPRTQFVSDSADLERFISCESVAAVRRCVLTDSVPVMLVRVTMIAPDSAEALVGTYRMFDARCPSGVRIDPPLIAIDQTERRTLVYRAGQWTERGYRRMAVC
jgi:CO dehydrogenase/acetyl-CoA synthase beta subunit